MYVPPGLIFVAALRKEWSMTCIAVRCPQCQSEQSVKRGKTARGVTFHIKWWAFCHCGVVCTPVLSLQLV